jgi:hypothetical protein
LHDPATKTGEEVSESFSAPCVLSLFELTRCLSALDLSVQEPEISLISKPDERLSECVFRLLVLKIEPLSAQVLLTATLKSVAE